MDGYPKAITDTDQDGDGLNCKWESYYGTSDGSLDYDGDVYQINFSQRFECDYDTRPIELFHWQNCFNPSPYAAYIGGGFHVVSASPEMFITINDDNISTKPIKGTRPRINKTSVDVRNFNELVNSEKEQAELNMIIDLERNDLGRVCSFGSVRVDELMTLERYSHVNHLVSHVCGTLKNDATGFDLLRCSFMVLKQCVISSGCVFEAVLSRFNLKISFIDCKVGFF
jgi:para-aminobenzoate synthetase component 1